MNSTSKNSSPKKLDPAKLVGFAIIALRANVKALDMQSGSRKSTERFRYDIAKDRSVARIIDTNVAFDASLASEQFDKSSSNQVVAGTEKSLEEWARPGKAIRLAKIGLIDTKIVLEDDASRASETVYVRYTYNCMTGEAFLDKNGTRLTEIPESVKENFTKHGFTTLPSTIEEWAKVGREVEKLLFESLKAAQEYGSKDGEKDTRAKMIVRGVIREPRTQGAK
jgi:hypothetical protein